MSVTMSSRERVLMALSHEEPDRVPTALWGSYYTLQDQTYVKMLQHLDLGDPVPPFRRFKTRNSNYHDDRVLDRLGTDVRYVWLGFTDLGGARLDTLKDAWGVQWRRIGPNVSSVEHPLADATMDELEAYPFPDVERYITIPALKERLAALKRDGRYAIAARAVNSYGPFEQAATLRGRERFLMDLLLEPEFAQLLINRVTDVLVRLTEIYLDVLGKDVDIIEIPGDDYGASDNLLFSPAIFDKMVKPALDRIIRPIKQYRSDIFVAFHSDGAIAPLLERFIDLGIDLFHPLEPVPANERFIDLGIDLFHPLEPVPANDIPAIKKQFGDRLAFMGAIDTRAAMPGSMADLEAEVQNRIRTLAQGGGYILAPANHVQTDVPPQNIVALYDLARKHGRYPLE